MENQKFLICVPEGGFNDILSRIWYCYEYCKKYKRVLVIDTRKTCLGESIYRYLETKDPIIYNGDLDTWYESIKTKTIYPPELSGLTGRVPAKFNLINNNIIYNYNETIVSIGLDREYSEDILYYCSCGGSKGIKTLQLFTFTKEIQDDFQERYMQMPKPYIGIHIRNTDRKSDVHGFLSKYKKQIQNKHIFLASDNIDTIQEIKEEFGSYIHTFSEIPKLEGKRNIHDNHPTIDNHKFNKDMILDLLLLASANEFIFSCIQSGYSRLADDLYHDKKILNIVLGKN